MSVEYRNPPELGEPLGSYSHIAVHDGIVSIAGQVGIRPDGTVAEGDVHSQVTQAFENIRVALASEGLSPSDLLQLTTYLVDADHIPAFFEARNSAFAELFPSGGYPPNTLLVINRLVRPEFLVEMSAIAVRPR